MNAVRIASLVAALAVTTWSCSGFVAHTSVVPGDIVRVTAPSMDIEKSVGTVTALDTDTLIVQVGEPADALHVALADVTRLEIHRGKQSRTDTGALIGAGAGAAAGLITALALCAGDECRAYDARELGAVFLGVVGGGLGAGIGYIIGSNIHTDRWEEVPLDRLRVSILPQRRGGLTLSASLRL